MTVTPLGQDRDCSLKNLEPDVRAPWFLDPRGRSKTAAVRLYFIFPEICTLSLRTLWMFDDEEYSYLEAKLHLMLPHKNSKQQQQNLTIWTKPKANAH
ncbi:hypothetical protein STEG23_004394 [Scotinomys teguina]